MRCRAGDYVQVSRTTTRGVPAAGGELRASACQRQFRLLCVRMRVLVHAGRAEQAHHSLVLWLAGRGRQRLLICWTQ